MSTASQPVQSQGPSPIRNMHSPSEQSSDGGALGSSIQVKLLLPVALVLVGVLAVTFFTFRQLLVSRGVAELEAKSAAIATMASQAMAEGVEFKDQVVLRPMLDGITSDEEVLSASVHDDLGNVLVSKGEAEAISIGSLQTSKPVVGSKDVTVVRPIFSKEGKKIGAVRLVYSRKDSLAAVRAASRTYSGISFVMLGVGLVAVWTSLGRVVKPVRVLTMATSRIVNEGDLTQKVPVTSKDEVGSLALAFNRMLDRLRQIPMSLQGSVDDLGRAVGGLTQLTRNQNSSVARQASGLAEASATTQEIKQTSALAAAKAETVLGVATRAEELSGAGQTAVENSLSGIQEIRSQIESIVGKIADLSERTLQVGEIIESVKDLADQSNVLALNAAIEAAKAGEFGKGFGVVAREIRSLADQSIQSTARIREILSEIQGAIRSTVAITEEGKKKMEMSMEQIRASGENLREMTAIVQESSQAARQIAASVNQQNVGITQISAAIGSLNVAMDETTKEIRAAEQAVENLKGISGRISEIVEAFQV